MKKPIKIILILTMLLIVQRSVNAYSNIPKDMDFGKCVEFQQSSPENVMPMGINHCMQIVKWSMEIKLFKNSLPFCLNGTE